MRVSRWSSMTLRFGAWAAATWLCAGSAFAGDGGASLGSLQNIIGTDSNSGLCGLFNSLLGTASACPQLPTISQAVLEVAGLENSPPEMVRTLNNVDPGNYVDAGNPAALLPVDPHFPFTPTTLPNFLSTLRPLAFISASNSNGPAKATQLFNSAADAFLYAVTSGPPPVSSGGLPIPDTLYLFYDDPSRTNSNFSQGQIIAKFSLPLTVLNSDGSEREVAATLQFRSPGSGGQPCTATPPATMSASTVVGDFAGTGTGTQTYGANQIGVDCAVVFAQSPISSKAHAIFLVKLRLLLTLATDPGYFVFSVLGPNQPVNLGIPSAFFNDDTGFMPPPPPVTNPPTRPILGAGKSIGIAPSAAPLCTVTGTPGTGIPGACSNPPPSGIFALCANLPGNGNGQPPVPSVAAFYGIGTDGETFLSAPIVPSSPIACPTMPG